MDTSKTKNSKRKTQSLKLKAKNFKRKTQSLKGKKVLITAGPTWAAIDDVRVISNTATGETGRLLAEKLTTKGAKVALLINAENRCWLNKKIKILTFRFFDQLKKHIVKEVSSGRYDIFIHSAAVSDYRPAKSVKGKINSGKFKLRLDLVPTPKIINRIKKIDSSLFLVGFKYEPGNDKKTLIQKAKKLMSKSNADIIVANTSGKKGYQAYIINRDKIFCGPVYNKSVMINSLIQAINRSFGLKKTLQKSN
ncbi:MAG: phosphopantothenoylcysteine decarboxylase [Candidatus Omnitrophota bacterium]